MAPEKFDRFESVESKDSSTKKELNKLQTEIEKKFLHNPLDQVLSPEEKKYFNKLQQSNASGDQKNDILAKGLYETKISVSYEKETKLTTLQEIIHSVKNKIMKKYGKESSIILEDSKVPNFTLDLQKYLAESGINSVNSDVVALLQTYLNSKGIKAKPGYTTGIENTNKDTPHYLLVDGIMGPHTLNALMQMLQINVVIPNNISNKETVTKPSASKKIETKKTPEIREASEVISHNEKTPYTIEGEKMRITGLDIKFRNKKELIQAAHLINQIKHEYIRTKKAGNDENPFNISAVRKHLEFDVEGQFSDTVILDSLEKYPRLGGNQEAFISYLNTLYKQTIAKPQSSNTHKEKVEPKKEKTETK